MLRRGRSLALPALVVLVAAVASCSSGSGDDADADDPANTTADTTPATLPDEVDAGRGAMVVGGSAYVLTVRECSLESTTDPETGVTTDLAIDADDGVGTSVSLTRSVTEGAVPSVTDTITIGDVANVVITANRVEVNGRFVDLLAEGALQSMLSIDGDVVTGEGVAGPPGARPDALGVLEVSVRVRCQ